MSSGMTIVCNSRMTKDKEEILRFAQNDGVGVLRFLRTCAKIPHFGRTGGARDGCPPHHPEEHL